MSEFIDAARFVADIWIICIVASRYRHGYRLTWIHKDDSTMTTEERL